MIPAYPLTWPEDWKRTTYRKAAKFSRYDRKLSVMDGVERVLAELDRLGHGRDDIVISTNLRTRLDGFPRSNEPEPADPGVAVYWQKPDGSSQRVIAIDAYTTVAGNLGAIAATLDAMRAIERHGGAQILERAFTGFTALPSPETVTAPGWRSVLGIDPAAAVTRDMIEHRYKVLRSAHHPDKGGSAEAFHAVTRAYEQALLAVGV